jgi:SRSO17 transposase
MISSDRRLRNLWRRRGGLEWGSGAVAGAVRGAARAQGATADVPLYVAGLIGPGDRKSVEPVAARLAPGDYDQLHHFIASGVWDEAPLQEELAIQADKRIGGPNTVLVVDDTALPKKGTHSVGVAPQYASALGKTANCQTLVTLARDEVPVMIGLRLFLPESWTGDADRMAKARVPETWRAARTKPEIALAEIDRIRAAGVRFATVLADAGYGLSAPFRQGLDARGLRWAVGIPKLQKVYPSNVKLVFPVAGRGRPRRRPIPDQLSAPAEDVLEKARWRRVIWRKGTKGPLAASFAALRVRIADGSPQRIHDKGAQHMPGEEAWLVGERRVSASANISFQSDRRREPQDARRHDQGALGLRTGPSATQGRTRPRSLRGALLARPPSSRVHDHDRIRLPAKPPPR